MIEFLTKKGVKKPYMAEVDIVEEITQGDSTPKVKSFGQALVNFLYAVTAAATLKVMVLRLVAYFTLLIGIVLSIVASVIAESALVFFLDFVKYLLLGIAIFALTEIINRKKT